MPATPTTRRATTLALLALFGAMAAGGPGLHAMPGLGHAPDADHAEACDWPGPELGASDPHGGECAICHVLLDPPPPSPEVRSAQADPPASRPPGDGATRPAPSGQRPDSPRAPPAAA